VTPAELRRLRWRPTAAYGAVALVVLLALAALAIAQARDQRYEQRDRLLERTALSASGYAYPQGNPSRLEIDRQPDGYFGPNRRPGPGVAVVDRHGRLVAGTPTLLDARSAERAYARVHDGAGVRLASDDSAGRRLRIAATPIPGGQGVIGAIVAAEPRSVADADVHRSVLLILAAALGLWLVTILAGWLLTGRVLRRVANSALREEAFLADAAHELRTPVAVIRARAEQALLTPEAPAAEALHAIERAAQRASVTIADMLELARLEARRERFEREPLRLDLLLEQVVEEHRDVAAAAGVQIHLDATEAVVLGDERLLARAIANLVENATRYGADGGATEIDLASDRGAAVITVRDRGPGVPPAQQAAIFDRFHRASGTAGGSGLGLPIARLIAETHQGTLALLPAGDDIPGATFVLRLPLAPDAT